MLEIAERVAKPLVHVAPNPRLNEYGIFANHAADFCRRRSAKHDAVCVGGEGRSRLEPFKRPGYCQNTRNPILNGRHAATTPVGGAAVTPGLYVQH
jgi:hypothetical protein